MGNTKEKLCETAAKLFNDKGYENVSLREIAKEAGTTIGNLTYHFKKKEDLVLAIVSDLHQDYSFYFSYEIKGVDLLRELLRSFRKAEENQKKYPFYFRNMNELAYNSEHFIEIEDEFQKNLHNFYLSCLFVLQEDGIIKRNIDNDDLYILSTTLLHVVSSWSTVSAPNNNSKLRKYDLPSTLIRLLKPYIEDNYQDILISG